MTSDSKYNGFKLISLKLSRDKVFGTIIYDFLDEEDEQDEIYTTVIIGSNGTRKSLLFRRLITLLWDLYTLSKDKTKTFNYDFAFSLRYSLDNLIYEYSNIHGQENFKIKRENYLTIDGIIQRHTEDSTKYSFENAYIPDTIVACTSVIPDKFPFPDEKSIPQYKYLGHRYRPQLAGTSTAISRTVNYLSNSLDNRYFIDSINHLLEEFFNPEFDPYFTFYTQNTSLFFGEGINVDSFSKFYEDIDTKYQQNGKVPPFKLNHYLKNCKNNPKFIQELIDFCLSLKQADRLGKVPRSSKKSISYKINDSNSLEELKRDNIKLNHLKNLGIVQSPLLQFLKFSDKEVSGYTILDSSSGEYNLFSAMIGLMATVKPTGSLILIDEPEVSLHPNWQMRYLEFIRTLFQNPLYAKSHILVATHSHFFVSDTKGDNSKIIGLTRDPVLKTVPLPKNVNTFGWSAEEVLLEVFQTPTTRNFFISEKIGEILELISHKDRNESLIREKVGILINQKVFSLSENDPLKNIWSKLVSKYGQRS